jgi:hypothetical protein
MRKGHEVKGWWLIQGQVTGDSNQLILVLLFINSCKARSNGKKMAGLLRGKLLEKEWIWLNKDGLLCLSRDGCY